MLFPQQAEGEGPIAQDIRDKTSGDLKHRNLQMKAHILYTPNQRFLRPDSLFFRTLLAIKNYQSSPS